MAQRKPRNKPRPVAPPGNVSEEVRKLLEQSRGGRHSKLTTVRLARFAQGLLTGAPLTAVARRCNVTRETVRRWRQQGAEEEAQGLDTLHVRFVALVEMAEGIAEVDTYWAAIHRAAQKGTAENVAAAKVAERALRLRWGRKYDGWREKLAAQLRQGPEEVPVPGLGEGKPDLSRLSDEERAELERLTRKLMAAPGPEEESPGGE